MGGFEENRQVEVLISRYPELDVVKENDVFLRISTSGNSKNILYAAVTAHAKGMKVIGLTGQKESELSRISDVCIKAPQTETYMIQELHLPIYHCLCLMLEERFFGVENISKP